MIDIIVVGAGPAGLTAAIYASRALKKVLVFEYMAYGGQIINSLDVENYPAAPHISGVDFANQIYNQAKELGAEIVFDENALPEDIQATSDLFAKFQISESTIFELFFLKSMLPKI